MPERHEYRHGVPSWIDLMTPDRERSKAFYGALFGWTYTEEPTDQGPTYTMCERNGRSAAGMGPLPPDMEAQGMPPMWNTYVTVDDVDASVQRAESAGGAVIMPTMDVVDAGRMAGVADPTGAVMMLWQAKQHVGATLVNEHGTLTWNELLTPDVDQAGAFYGELFGWTSQSMDMPDGTIYTVFMLGDDQVAGAMNPPDPAIPPSWLVYFAIDDIDATAGAAEEYGGQLLSDPIDAPPGILLPVQDPQGAVFSVIQLHQPPQQ